MSNVLLSSLSTRTKTGKCGKDKGVPNKWEDGLAHISVIYKGREALKSCHDLDAYDININVTMLRVSLTLPPKPQEYKYPRFRVSPLLAPSLPEGCSSKAVAYRPRAL
jgi:hypothetical protein